MSGETERIKNIVRKEMRYLGVYSAKVERIINDNSGVLILSVPFLGWEDEESFSEAQPSDSISRRIMPEVGDWIEIYFLDGQEETPRWRSSILTEIKQGQPVQYSKPTDRILFEDRLTGDFIKYDAETKELKIKVSGDVTIDVKGDATVTAKKLSVNDGNLEVT